MCEINKAEMPAYKHIFCLPVESLATSGGVEQCFEEHVLYCLYLMFCHKIISTSVRRRSSNSAHVKRKPV